MYLICIDGGFYKFETGFWVWGFWQLFLAWCFKETSVGFVFFTFSPFLSPRSSLWDLVIYLFTKILHSIGCGDCSDFLLGLPAASNSC